MTAKQPQTIGLKEAALREAFALIEEKGVENLSLREVARRLGVSHQAPYKHFPSRDHILAAIVARCYADFSRHMRNHKRGQDEFADLKGMGAAYLEYAERHPLQYRLMFNTPLPPPAEHPEMMEEATGAFALLHEKLKALPLRELPGDGNDKSLSDAIFVWSALHGLASVMQSDALKTLGLSDAERLKATERAMARLGAAIEPDV